MASLKYLGKLHAISLRKVLTMQSGTAVKRHFSVTSAAGVSAGEHISYEVTDGIAVVKMDTPNSKVNVLSETFGNEMEATLDTLIGDDAVQGVVLISKKPGCFIAGADINMLGSFKTAEEVQEVSRNGQIVFERVEKNPKPVVAAISGTCLGGA
ncbi:hypothetical protein BSL78_01663 [Apostichopus japonicus]|uniref:Trifunctional enzyme subunit alpha, mitochondrial n=1 Tax=Stichopus japonicus TaxID=307972 RepID=A0A2G8LMK8_STIJA|nr:hypothetical protein BSL78_01663 [Apostichopus japonicus]